MEQFQEGPTTQLKNINPTISGTPIFNLSKNGHYSNCIPSYPVHPE